MNEKQPELNISLDKESLERDRRFKIIKEKGLKEEMDVTFPQSSDSMVYRHRGVISEIDEKGYIHIKRQVVSINPEDGKEMIASVTNIYEPRYVDWLILNKG